jgi:uncharacterized protein (TIGR02300 family)
MPAKDLGGKHVCFKCGTRFYDLNKPAAVCPKCGADQREAPVVKAPAAEKRARPPARPVVAEPEESPDAEVALDAVEEGDEDAEEPAADEEDEP